MPPMGIVDIAPPICPPRGQWTHISALTRRRGTIIKNGRGTILQNGGTRAANLVAVSPVLIGQTGRLYSLTILRLRGNKLNEGLERTWWVWTMQIK